LLSELKAAKGESTFLSISSNSSLIVNLTPSNQ